MTMPYAPPRLPRPRGSPLRGATHNRPDGSGFGRALLVLAFLVAIGVIYKLGGS